MQLQVVITNLFHQWKQEELESENQYAKGQRKFFVGCIQEFYQATEQAKECENQS